MPLHSAKSFQRLIQATAFVLALSSSSAMAATLYVGPTGNDKNDGLSVARPFKTLQKAADSLKAGDTMMVMTGVYTSNPNVYTRAVMELKTSGTADKPVVVQAMPGHKPVISMQKNAKVLFGIQSRGINYLTIKGFEIIGTAKDYTLATATAIAKRDIQKYVDSVRANQKDPKVGIATPLDFGVNSAGINIELSHHVNILSNVVHDQSGHGIQAARSDYVRIQSNTVYNTSIWTYYDTSGIGIHRMMNFDQYTGYKNFVINNVTHHNGNAIPYYDDVKAAMLKGGTFESVMPTDGNGIIMDLNNQTVDGKPYTGRTLIMSNIAYKNGGVGIHTFHSDRTDIINNTAYMNGAGSCPVAGSTCGNNTNGQITGAQSADMKIFNNIMFSPATVTPFSAWFGKNIEMGNNIMFNQGSKTILKLKNFMMGATDIVADPMFFADEDLDRRSVVTPRESVTLLRVSNKSPAADKGSVSMPVAKEAQKPVGIDNGSLVGHIGAVGILATWTR